MTANNAESLPTPANQITPNTVVRYVTVNALVTAGPRKGADDSFELGEDGAGVCQCGELTGFWLADGTTSSSEFAGLSTRKLVQDLGAQFLSRCTYFATAGSSTTPSEQLIEEVCHNVQQLWLGRIADYWGRLDPTSREALLTRLPSTVFGVRQIDWSLVFLCGIINSSTGTTTIWHCGDCFGYFFSGNGDHTQVKPRPGRLFLRLRISDIEADPELSVIATQETLQQSTIREVEAFVCMTDGVAKHRMVTRQIECNETEFTKCIDNILSLRAVMDDDRGMIYGTIRSEEKTHQPDDRGSKVADQNFLSGLSPEEPVDVSGPDSDPIPEEHPSGKR
jgi:hypothetical protein